jgi:hypothetical protein
MQAQAAESSGYAGKFAAIFAVRFATACVVQLFQKEL